MFRFTKAGPALTAVAAAALTAAIGSAAPAAAATARPAAPAACTIRAAMDRAEHTGKLFATGWATCPVRFDAAMHVNLWIDRRVVRGRSMACRLGSNCFTSSGSSFPARGRHRYCAEATFFIAGDDPSAQVWSCRYQ